MKRYGTVLLDADETLFDFRRSEREALLQAFTESGLPTDDAFLDTYCRINNDLWARFDRGEIPKQTIMDERFVRLFAQFGIHRDGKAFNDLYFDRLARLAYLLPGAEDLCRTLHGLGMRTAIATNGASRVQKSRFRRSGLAHWVDGIFVSEDVGAAKPDKLYFERVLHALGDPPCGSVLMVGDSPVTDVAGALAAGIDACFLDAHGTGDVSGATFCVRSLTELKNLFLSEAAYGTDIAADH